MPSRPRRQISTRRIQPCVTCPWMQFSTKYPFSAVNSCVGEREGSSKLERGQLERACGAKSLWCRQIWIKAGANVTCCQGEEYQPKTTAVELGLPAGTRGGSGHGPRLQTCWRSTKGLATFLHLRKGNSTYLYERRRGWGVCSTAAKLRAPTQRTDREIKLCVSIPEIWRLEAPTRPESLSPRSEAHVSGRLSHRIWSTEPECRRQGQF